MTDGGPYTTITVNEYNHMADVIRGLRKCKQDARVALEQGHLDKALALLCEENY